MPAEFQSPGEAGGRCFQAELRCHLFQEASVKCPYLQKAPSPVKTWACIDHSFYRHALSIHSAKD